MHMSCFRTLQEHPVLLQLYRDLVITEIISSEEFWAQHAAEYTQAKKIQRQDIGVNSAFLVRYLSVRFQFFTIQRDALTVRIER